MAAEFPEKTEATTTRLGTLAAIGFVGLMVYIVALLSGWRSDLDDGSVAACAALLFIAFLWCTVGGFGSVFNTLVSPVIRAYNRIIVFVVFLILAACGKLATGWLNRKPWAKSNSVLVGLIVVVLTVLSYLDVRWIFIQAPTERLEALSDRAFVAKIEGLLGGKGMVFQLPFMEFPAAPRPGKMDSIDPARAYLHSASLQWSWGVVRGTAEARWMQRTAELPPDELVRELLARRFRGLWIDTYGYLNNQSTLPQWIAAVLGRQPVVSPDGRYQFFELDAHQQLRRIQPTNRISESPLSQQHNVEGFDDAVNCDYIAGWAWDRSNPNAILSVDIYDGQTLLTTLPADRFRSDLVAASIGNGYHAYYYPFPIHLRDGRPHMIHVVISGSGRGLTNTGRSVTCRNR
jgi:hypothetical protein